MTLADSTHGTRTPAQERGEKPMKAALLTENGADGGKSPAELLEITFVRPIPGFADLVHFVLIPVDGDDSVISELRSLEQPEVRFVGAAPAVFFADYAIEIDQQDCDHLGLTSADDALILTVLTVGAEPVDTTANLLAPIVINVLTRSAVQVILTGSDWSVRAPLG
jgi:flagellar assembly factor FliW